MNILPKPEVIFTHESDLDGLISGLLLRKLAFKLFETEVPLQTFHTDSWHKRKIRENSAWVSDLSFDSRYDKDGWVIIDHHMLSSTPTKAKLIHDTTRCASSLCYDLCRENGIQSPALDKLVHLCNVADLFIESDPDFLLATDYSNLVKTYQFWNIVHLIEWDLDRLLDHPLLEVMAVKRKIENPIGTEFSRKKILELAPGIGFVETAIGNPNIILNNLLQDAAIRYDVLVTINKRVNGSLLVSFRSRNGRALKVASFLRGGGHPNAAGTVLPKSVQNVEEAIQYMRRILNPEQNNMKELNSLEDLFEAAESEINSRND